MAAVKKQSSFETTFLREFAKDHGTEVGITVDAEIQMRAQLVTLACVHQVMRSGDVVLSDKESAECSMWVVVGETCNDTELRIELEVIYDRYRMTILDVKRK